jgi:hypothetical protein
VVSGDRALEIPCGRRGQRQSLLQFTGRKSRGVAHSLVTSPSLRGCGCPKFSVAHGKTYSTRSTPDLLKIHNVQNIRVQDKPANDNL